MRLSQSVFLLTALAPLLQAEDIDLLVYGATPAGVAAALAAGRDGARVLLVEPRARIGGMVTNGLSHADFRTFESLSGLYFDFSKRVEAFYERQYGRESPQFKECLRGTNAEPKVNLAVLEEMLAEVPTVKVQRSWELENLRCSGGTSTNGTSARSLEMALFMDSQHQRHTVAAHYFVDATYEGDLLAAAEIPYKVGREGRAESGETAAPPTADDQIQAYNFRMIMTRDPANRAPVRRPEGYDRAQFSGILPLLESGKIPKLFDTKPPAVFKAQVPALPNGKFDINDVSHSLVRLSLPGENNAWPDGVAGTAIRQGPERGFLRPPFSRLGLAESRQPIFDDHKRWCAGLLYFLRNDDAVPSKYRDEARSWSFARDEFEDNYNFPEQLYIREARRMKGVYNYSEKDTQCAPNDARAVLHRDSIAVCDYGPNCHGTDHEGSMFGGRHTGEFYQTAAPYQIPYGVLVAPGAENLLVTCAVGSTHVGFCSLRFEPVWMSLGEAAGHAAVLANKRHSSVHQVSIANLQRVLHSKGAATVYVSDVSTGHPDFAAVQWWANAGGLHGVYPAFATPGQRGAQIAGQYYQAFPGHTAGLEVAMEPGLTERWIKIAENMGISAAQLPAPEARATRGAWIRAAWDAQNQAR